MSAHSVLKSLLRTEKGTRDLSRGKYLFAVSPRANKIEIKKAVESVYKVKVRSVNTAVVPGKLKRVRVQIGHTPEWKKAVVTLKQGQKIDLA
ncbi:MAG: 50S ribosomal protein L23 [Candidatus Omnitrophica bacterium]|nr:50S ribosomal protein L23 [Candidatus Omnitrophota bacterium]